MGNSWKIAIGVVPLSYKKTTNSSFTFIAPNYGLIGSNKTLSGNGQRKRIEQVFGEREGDELRMRLDLQKYTLSYRINENEESKKESVTVPVTAPSSPKEHMMDELKEEHYKMAVSMCRGRKLQLVSTGWYR